MGDLERLGRRTRRRLLIRSVVSWPTDRDGGGRRFAGRLMLWSTVAAVLAIVIARLFGFTPWIALVLAIPIVGHIVVTAARWGRSTTPVSALGVLDGVLGFDDLLSSALAMRGSGDGAGFERLTVTSGEALSQRVDHRAALPVRPSSGWLALLPFWLIGVLVAMFVPALDLRGSDPVAQPGEVSREEVVELLDDVRATLDEDDVVRDDARERQVLDEIDRLQEELERGEVAPKEAAYRAAHELNKLTDPEAATESDEATEPPGASDASLEPEDLKRAEQLAEELDDRWDELSPTERTRTLEELERLAERIDQPEDANEQEPASADAQPQPSDEGEQQTTPRPGEGEQRERPSEQPGEGEQRERPSEQPGEGEQREQPSEQPGEGEQRERPSEQPGEGEQREQPSEQPGEGEQRERPSEEPGEGEQREGPSEQSGEGEERERPSEQPGAGEQRERPSEQPGEGERRESPSEQPGGGEQRERPSEQPGEGEQRERPSEQPGEGEQRERPSEQPGEGEQRERLSEQPGEGEQRERPSEQPGEGEERERLSEQPGEGEQRERPSEQPGEGEQRERPSEQPGEGEQRERPSEQPGEGANREREADRDRLERAMERIRRAGERDGEPPDINELDDATRDRLRDMADRLSNPGGSGTEGGESQGSAAGSGGTAREEAVDLRGEGDAPIDEERSRVIGEWYGDGTPTDSAVPASEGRARFESARRAAERAIEDRTVHPRYRDFLRRYFDRFAEGESEGDG